jgi:hypothetical protein
MSGHAAKTHEELKCDIDALGVELFSFLDEGETLSWDRRALLALHSSVAARGSFTYLEIGSYLGGSLQALVRDPRCRRIISIDSRTAATPDTRGSFTYEDNTTQRMLDLLGGLPNADINKLATFEHGSQALHVSDLPGRPDFCFIDGEHTHDAALRDARFCADAIEGTGVIAFHDYGLVGSAISAFLREAWRDISFALAFTGPSDVRYGGGVFALEMGTNRLLRAPIVDRAVGSRWHSLTWRAVNSFKRTPLPVLWAWAIMPAIDLAVVQLRDGHSRYVQQQAHAAHGPK